MLIFEKVLPILHLNYRQDYRIKNYLRGDFTRYTHFNGLSI